MKSQITGNINTDISLQNYYFKRKGQMNTTISRKLLIHFVFNDTPDQTGAKVQSPALFCFSSWPDTDRMTETGKQIHQPCPTTTDLAVACSPLHAIQPGHKVSSSECTFIH